MIPRRMTGITPRRVSERPRSGRLEALLLGAALLAIAACLWVAQRGGVG